VGRFTISKQLIAGITFVVVAVVGFLAAYFPARQVRDLGAGMEHKAQTYGRLLGQQVRSAVAFDDRETAREVIDAVAADPDVSGAVLYGQHGEALARRGQMERWDAPESRAATVQRLEKLGDRIVVIEPVVALEGPRGTMVIELSTSGLIASSREVKRTAIQIGIVAALLGVLVAWLLARSIARRLRAIATVVTSVADGNLEQPPVDDAARDEIGTLARGFNTMVAQLRDLISEIQRRAHDEQQRLEGEVRARTRELDDRNREMRLVLDHVAQGFVTIDLHGAMATERSASVARMFGPPPATEHLVDYLSTSDQNFAAALALGLDEIRDGVMPLELTLDQLPHRLETRGRHLRVDYTPISNESGVVQRLLVVVSDETTEIERQRAEEVERDLLALLPRLLGDRQGFDDFFAEARTLLDEISSTEDLVHRDRSLHTLKGICGIYGVAGIAARCHELEDQLAAGELVDLGALRSRWEALSSRVRPLLGSQRSGLQVSDQDYEQLLGAVESQPRPILRGLLLDWKLEPVQTRFERLVGPTQQIARRLGKQVEVQVESNGVRLDPHAYGAVWSTLVHVVRNAIDHGLESPDERLAARKPVAGQIVLRSKREGASILLEIVDDGRGIDWTKIADAAMRSGRPANTREQLVEALFADGVSSATTITQVSGRGVGMGAFRAAVTGVGGTLDVITTSGRGTTWRCTLPVATSRRSHTPSSAPPRHPARAAQ